MKFRLLRKYRKTKTALRGAAGAVGMPDRVRQDAKGRDGFYGMVTSWLTMDSASAVRRWIVTLEPVPDDEEEADADAL